VKQRVRGERGGLGGGSVVCVCLCVRERERCTERDRERERERERERGKEREREEKREREREREREDAGCTRGVILCGPPPITPPLPTTIPPPALTQKYVQFKSPFRELSLF